MRILMYQQEGHGGMANYTKPLCEALSQWSDVTIVTVAGNSYQEGRGFKVLEVLRPLSSSVNKGRLISQLRTVAVNLANISRLAVLSILSPTSTIHIQKCLHLTDWMVLLPLRLMKRRVVLTVHDVYPHSWLLPPFLRGVERATLRLLYKSPQRLIVHTERGRQQLVKDFHISSSDVRVIPHGANPQSVRRLDKGPNARANILVFGNITRYKGIEVLIRALGYINEDVEVVIAGRPTDQRYVEQCRKLALDLGVAGSVVWVTKFVSEIEVTDMFMQADLCVLPYICFDSQSGVLLQALAHGVPVIVSDVGGLGELVGDCGVGRVFRPGDHENLAVQILELIQNPELLRTYSEAGFRVVSDAMSWGKVAEQHRQLYESL